MNIFMFLHFYFGTFNSDKVVEMKTMKNVKQKSHNVISLFVVWYKKKFYRKLEMCLILYKQFTI